MPPTLPPLERLFSRRACPPRPGAPAARSLLIALSLLLAAYANGQPDATLRIDASHPSHSLTRYLTGACIEDVNHEIYGGIYSQLIFGENFQEPPRSSPIKNFLALEGDWKLAPEAILEGGAGPGPKLIPTDIQPFSTGEVGVDILLPDNTPGNAGLIVKVNRPALGADNFDGYEISIDAARNRLVLGRHRHDWKPLTEAPYEAPLNHWITLSAKLTDRTIDISVDGKSLIQYEDRDRPLRAGIIGLRQWQRPARYRNLWIKPADAAERRPLPFEPTPDQGVNVSGMWQPYHNGSAVLRATIEKDRPFIGAQSQRISFLGGEGEAGIENQGLNRWGISLIAGKPYDGYLWLRAETATELITALDSRDGSHRYAETRLPVAASDWRRIEFTLTPSASDPAARFSIALRSPASVILGHAFLQPGPWGRFKDLPLRRDVVEGLLDQGITVLRYGGSMVNAPEYRWKKMIGPRDRRPPYAGTWYPQSTNGWGIIDFLDLCEAAGFLAVPDFNADETPQDMADFVEYVNSPPESEWGRRRAQGGHPKPYNLRHLEFGNEERIDDHYFERFKPVAEAIWAKDPQLIPIVGDFLYSRPITDPMKFTGAASGITTLAAHQKILDLTRAHDREVWFDVHVGTEGPRPSNELKALPTFIDALAKVSAGARHKVVVFEFNANNPEQRRALANAQAINTIERDGRLPIALSANCLQPDGQNDNGWNQGLLFLNPTQVWLQPPGYITRMFSRNYQPKSVPIELTGGDGHLDASAKISEDHKTLVLQVVNTGEKPLITALNVMGFAASPQASVEELAAPMNARNTAQHPTAVVPAQRQWHPELKDGQATYTFPPSSVTVLRFE
jgi:hypothetical protein